ncbi:ComF family protein [Labrenzia sp. OB1]|uniref:ComF family protein n=1 Tax=Labrenzia sp. OB1 TaxID=1561204 RepID=UPI001AD910B4|nr:ComF family protein [Labrenzia sp. OB1]
MIGKNLISAPGTAAGMVLDFLLPLRCLCCEAKVASEDSLCPKCWQDMHFIEKPWCHRLGIPFTYDVGDGAWSPRAIASPPVFDRLRSVAFYEGPARQLVLALKFSRRRELARSMGCWMSRSGSEFLDRDSLIIPVPLHWLRLLSRRFNQSADLAKAVARNCGGEFEPDLLKRKKRTRQQVGLSAKDRHKNVRSAFSIDAARVGALQGRHVVLVDDVMTTGSTVSACCKVLLASGAASVNVLTFALADPSIRSADGALSV